MLAQEVSNVFCLKLIQLHAEANMNHGPNILATHNSRFSLLFRLMCCHALNAVHIGLPTNSMGYWVITISRAPSVFSNVEVPWAAMFVTYN